MKEFIIIKNTKTKRELRLVKPEDSSSYIQLRDGEREPAIVRSRSVRKVIREWMKKN